MHTVHFTVLSNMILGTVPVLKVQLFSIKVADVLPCPGSRVLGAQDTDEARKIVSVNIMMCHEVVS